MQAGTQVDDRTYKWTNGQSASETCDIVEDSSNRLTCDPAASAQTRCGESHCCFDSSVSSGIPKCSFPKRCSIQKVNSSSCGNRLWRNDCLARGCCWFHEVDSKYRNRYCFLPYECDITPGNRVSCGELDIDDCVTSGCCYDESTANGIPNCFQATGCEYNKFIQSGDCLSCNCQQPCDRTSGSCSSMCVDGFIGQNCQTDGLPSFSFFSQNIVKKANSDQATTFICSVAYNVMTTVTIVTKSHTYGPTSTSEGLHPNYLYIHTFNGVIITNGENVTCVATYSGDTRREEVITATAFVQPKLTTAPWITGIGKTQMSVNWNSWRGGIDIGDGQIEKYEVWYRKTNENYTAYPQVVLPSQTSLVVDALSPHTDYMFAVKTYRPGVGGDGALSPNVTARTSCDYPLGSPIITEITPQTSSQIQVMWEINEVDLEPHRLQCVDVTSYTVHHRLNGSNAEYETITTDSEVTIMK
ncbi:uncharacterized protein LOC144436786 [Glandiceps talaboti]